MSPDAPEGVRTNPQAGHTVGAERPTNLKPLPPASHRSSGASREPQSAAESVLGGLHLELPQ